MMARRGPGPSASRDLVRRFATDRLAVVGAVTIAIVAIVALAAPLIAPFGVLEQTGDALASPSRDHLLGTDHLGRDVLSRVVWGSRASLMFGVVVAGVALVVGVTVGGVAGFYGRWIDHLLSRVLEVFLVIPGLLLLVVFSALFGPSLAVLAVVAGFTVWPTNARITRAQVLALKHEPYVESARAAGARDGSILVRHVLPNGLYPVIANSTLVVATAVILEASLSFLGLGDPNATSWGQVLRNGQDYLATAPWIACTAGAAIFLFVFSLNVCGDGINLALAPGARRPTGPLEDEPSWELARSEADAVERPIERTAP